VSHPRSGESRARILVVEDDPDLRASLAASLARQYQLEGVGDATSALARWEAGRPDLIILDLGLPDLDGQDLITHLRREASTPILVLSARDREADKVRALEGGADDYLTKPFGTAELDARIKALLRRVLGSEAGSDGVVRLGPLRVDAARHSVEVDGTPVRLTRREFEVLKVLVAHAGRLVTHARLLRAVWGTAYSEEAHYVHVYVSAIRRKLAAADPSGRLDDLIKNEPGVGYRVGDPGRSPPAAGPGDART
jgi:two-component system KDP operon response regulator KdpE